MKFNNLELFVFLVTIISGAIGVFFAKRKGGLGRKSYLISMFSILLFAIVSVIFSALITMGYNGEYFVWPVSVICTLFSAYFVARRCKGVGINPWFGILVGFPLFGILLIAYLIFANTKYENVE